jgi:hypothetical protein
LYKWRVLTGECKEALQGVGRRKLYLWRFLGKTLHTSSALAGYAKIYKGDDVCADNVVAE